MDPISSKTALATAGAGDKLYVDDVFSNYVYTGDGALETVNNGIDLDTEGGLVIVKNYSHDADWQWTDTERGDYQSLCSNNANGSDDDTDYGVAFTSTGFTAGKAGTSSPIYNASANNFVSYTFRKAKGFFDVVTYTSQAGVTAINHNLGTVPGCIIIKKLGSASMQVYHRSTGATKRFELDNPSPATTNSAFGNTTPTSTQFFIDTASNDTFGTAGDQFVAYLFAHDEQSFGTNSDQAIINCGSYTGNGATGGKLIDIGFEPQWVLVKAVTAATDNTFQVYDVMRGIHNYNTGGSNQNSAVLYANSNVHQGYAYQFGVDPKGFIAIDSHNNNNGVEYIYIAIRRPNKPPSAGTDVFAVDALGSTAPSPPGWTSGFPVDFAISKTKNTNSNWEAVTRVCGVKNYPNLDTTGSTIATTNDDLDRQNGWFDLSTYNPENFSWMFRRAEGFFDVATYVGTGGSHSSAPLTVNHNLGVTPELIIIKDRDRARDWKVWTTSEGDTKLGTLNGNTSWASDFQIKDVTSTTFKTGTDGAFTHTNYSGDIFLAYLFATSPGVSKIGTYTGTGAALNVDCGFTNGARFVLIKRTDANSDWVLFDTLRGINPGTESELSPNQPSPENTSKDAIDSYPQGFALTTDQGDTNVTGGSYIFLAIA